MDKKAAPKLQMMWRKKRERSEQGRLVNSWHRLLKADGGREGGVPGPERIPRAPDGDRQSEAGDSARGGNAEAQEACTGTRTRNMYARSEQNDSKTKDSRRD